MHDRDSRSNTKYLDQFQLVFYLTFDIRHKDNNCKAISSIMRHNITNKPAGSIMKPPVMIKIIIYDSHTGKCTDETNKLNYFKFIL